MTNYYRVLFADDYAKKKCPFGILDGDFDNKASIFEDGIYISPTYIEQNSFFFEGAKDQILADYQMSYFSLRIVSGKMKSVLDIYKNEYISFYPVNIQKDAEDITYYILRFNKKLDVLDKIKTGESLIAPKLDLMKLDHSLHIFCYDAFDPRSFCISEDVKKELQANNITGCSYQLIS